MPHPIVSFRLDPALVAQLDAYAERLAVETGVPVSRNAALSKLVTEALAESSSDRKRSARSRASRR